MPAYLLSGTTRPKRRQPENNTQFAPSRRQISDAPRRTRLLSEILLRAAVRSFINDIGCYFLWGLGSRRGLSLAGIAVMAGGLCGGCAVASSRRAPGAPPRRR